MGCPLAQQLRCTTCWGMKGFVCADFFFLLRLCAGRSLPLIFSQACLILPALFFFSSCPNREQSKASPPSSAAQQPVARAFCPPKNGRGSTTSFLPSCLCSCASLHTSEQRGVPEEKRHGSWGRVSSARCPVSRRAWSFAPPVGLAYIQCGVVRDWYTRRPPLRRKRTFVQHILKNLEISFSETNVCCWGGSEFPGAFFFSRDRRGVLLPARIHPSFGASKQEAIERGKR